MGPPTGRLTVAEALALPALQRGLPEVVAGRSRLDRAIRWAHAGEAPNLAARLRGGELLLTTGIGIDRCPDEQRRFVAKLAEAEVAALVVELGGAFGKPPPALREEARQRQLPLVLLHRGVPFVEVTEAVHVELADRRHGLPRRGAEIHRELVEVMLEGGGVPALLQALAELVGNPVVLESGDGSVLFRVRPSAAARDGSATGTAEALARPVAMGRTARPGRLVVLPLAHPVDALAEVALERATTLVELALMRARAVRPR